MPAFACVAFVRDPERISPGAGNGTPRGQYIVSASHPGLRQQEWTQGSCASARRGSAMQSPVEHPAKKISSREQRRLAASAFADSLDDPPTGGVSRVLSEVFLADTEQALNGVGLTSGRCGRSGSNP